MGLRHAVGTCNYDRAFCTSVSAENATSLQNPPNREMQIPLYIVVQIQIEILVSFEFIQRNLSFSICWISWV